MLESLLRNGGSALYLPVWRGELRHRLELTIAALEGRDQFAAFQEEPGGVED